MCIIKLGLNLIIYYHPASQTKVALFIINDAELSGSYSLYLLVGLNPVKIAYSADSSMRKFRSMTNFECNFSFIIKFSPRIFSDKREITFKIRM